MIDVNYNYTIFNQHNQTAQLKQLIDGSFNDVIDQSLLLQAVSDVSFQRTNKIDICRESKITQQVVGIATLVGGDASNGKEGAAIPFARDAITYDAP